MRFTTGAAWETIERWMTVLGPQVVSDTTLRARRDEWVEAGVFHQLTEDCLALYHHHVGIDMGDVSIDGSIQLCPGGGPDTNNAPGSKGHQTMKFRLGVDANGTGLAALVVKGSANDYPLLAPTLTEICARGDTSIIDRLHLDRGWVVERTNAWLTNFRQLKINWDRTVEHCLAAIQFGLAILMLYRIIDHHRANNLDLTSIR